ncbi:hypothetical protein B0J13DRAFT_676183 [Dactylonectria estremocensis]|uniref:Beta-lactamase-related domain-containing protein n=1 Tax=Dactylonectria estremocensis TaxID=1079267 RepID=A0A9P9EQ63_9HYPO|nr:hypothetical protein B0J13DRAFT_676183 [Dactylonectria estremocensis]
MENFDPALISPPVFNNSDDTASEGEINHSCKTLAFLEDRSLADLFIEICTGENPRWQVIGLLAVVAGLCAACLSPSDVLFVNNKVVVSDFVNEMVEISRACIAICRTCNAMNDLFVWLLHEHTRLVRAEHTKICWSRMRFRFFSQNCGNPFLLRYMSKELSTPVVLGRPIRLSHRYCSISPPLDSADDQITLEGADLEASLESLDLDGFNKSERLSRTTWLKVWLPFDRLREEVLNLALSQHTQEDILRQAFGIQQKSDQQWGKAFVILAQAAQQGLLAEAGEIVSYSNAWYMLLGALLKRVAECDWETLVQLNILDLLRPPVVNVVLDASKRPSEGRLRDPLRPGGPPVAEDYVPGPNASIADSATLLGSMLWGDLLTPSSRREMQSVEYRLPCPSLWCESWDRGWSVIGSGRGLVGHMGGTSTFMLGSVEMGKAVVFLSNTANGALVGWKLALRAPSLDGRQIPESVTTSGSDSIPESRPCGRCGTPAFFFEVSVSDDGTGRALAKSDLDSGDPEVIEKLSGSTFTGKLMSLPIELTLVSNIEGTGVQYLHAGFRALTKI